MIRVSVITIVTARHGDSFWKPALEYPKNPRPFRHESLADPAALRTFRFSRMQDTHESRNLTSILKPKLPMMCHADEFSHVTETAHPYRRGISVRVD